MLKTTTVGYPTVAFTEGPGDSSHLGSGTDFLDDVSGSQEVIANSSQIDGWWRTAMYHMRQEVIEKPVKLLVMVRFSSVQFRDYFSQTLNHSIGSVQQFP